MAEILSTVSLISFIVSGVCFAAAVFCWFKFKIPQVIGDLSGRTAKKSIERMRADNEKSGNRYLRPGKVNEKRGKLTERAPLAEGFKVSKKKGAMQSAVEETGLLEADMARGTREEETDLLTEKQGTDNLEEETVLLVNNEVIPSRQGGKQLTLLEEIILVYTDEVIR